MPSLDDPTWPVRTERLTLRRPRSGDVELTYAYRRVPEVAEWLTRRPADLASYAEWFTGDALASTLVLEHDGEVVGDLHVELQDGWAQREVAAEADLVEAELGWVLAPQHQGHGYATEAVRALLRICFLDLGLRRVTAGCFAANEPSWRIMEKVGMRREQHSLRDGLHRTRGWLDGYQYALLADEWAATSR